MIRIIKELNVEVTTPNIFQAIVAKQYDMNTRFLKVTFMDCGSRIDIPITGTSKVVINAERKDGQSKAFEGVINDDGTVTVPLHSWMLELEGTVICDISVIDTETDDEKKLTTTSFTLLVEKAAYGGDDITSDPQYDVLVNLIDRVEKLEAKNALKGTKSGSVISVNDVSPIEHDIKVTLSNEPTVNRFDIYGVGGDSVDPNHADRTIDVNTSDTVNLGKLTDICTGVKGGDTIKISFESDNINSVLSLALLKSDNSYTSICRVYSLTGSSAMGEDSYVICTLPEDISNIYVQHEGGEATLSDIFIGLESVLEDFSGVTVSRYGKNLFNPNLTEGTLESGGGNTSVRSDFEFDKYYVGFARNNYYYPYQVNSYNYDGDTFTFNLKAIYYGIGIPIKVKPNTKYIARAELSEECFLMAGFYTSEGEYINAITNSTNAFTTPANCGIVMLFLTSNNTNKVCTASNIQLEIGTTATDYEPYKEPQTATANADGTVEGLTSVSPNMTLVSDTERVVINLEYNIDTKMYIDNELAKIKAELSATIVNS